MEDIFRGVWVEPVDFRDPEWKDPEIRGWLTVFLLYCGISILYVLAVVYQLPKVSWDLKALMVSPLVLGVYAMAAICLRWRNAVFLSKAYVGLCLMFHLISFVGFVFLIILKSGYVVWLLISGFFVLLDWVWLLYFNRSELVGIRFPKSQRRAYRTDATIILYSYLVTIFISFIAIPVISTKNSPSINKTRKEVGYMNRFLPLAKKQYLILATEYYEGVIYVYATLDHELYGKRTGEEIKKLWRDEEAKDEFKVDMAGIFPDVIEYAIKHGHEICWRIYDNMPGDGFDIRMTPHDIENVKKGVAEIERLRDDAHTLLEEMVGDLKISNMKTPDPAIRLEKIVVESHHLAYCYEIDENQKSYTKVEDEISRWNNDAVTLVLNKDIRGDSLLTLAAKAGVDLVYRYRCNRSGFEKEYKIATLEELEEATLMENAGS